MDRQVTFVGKNNQVWSEQAHAYAWYQHTNWYKSWSCIMHMCRFSCIYQSFRPYPLFDSPTNPQLFQRNQVEKWQTQQKVSLQCTYGNLFRIRFCIIHSVCGSLAQCSSHCCTIANSFPPVKVQRNTSFLAGKKMLFVACILHWKPTVMFHNRQGLFRSDWLLWRLPPW